MTDSAGRVILLLEDKTATGQQLSAQLSDEGYTVLNIRDGRCFVSITCDQYSAVSLVLVNIENGEKIVSGEEEHMLKRDFTTPLRFLCHLVYNTRNSGDSCRRIPCYGYSVRFSGKTIAEAVGKLERFRFPERSGPGRRLTDGGKEAKSAGISKKEYRRNFSIARDGVFVLNASDGTIVQADGSLIDLLGCTLQELLGIKISDVRIFKSTAQAGKLFSELHKKERIRFTDIRLGTGDGRTLFVEVTSDVYVVDGRRLIECTMRDVTARMRYERKLRKLASENGLLMKELQHRIRNSLAIIINMISLKAMENEDAATRRVLGELIHRVNSISELYTLLHESGNILNIRLDTYCNKIIRSMFPWGQAFKIQKSIGPITVSAKKAGVTGMILVELLSNIIKYAFPNHEDPVIRIRIWKLAGKVLISVEDNGIGIADETVVSGQYGTGLKLVHMMVNQLNGRIKIRKKSGTSVIIRYPL
ncbi:MAG: PAS domain S-box protein [Spirochaetales bacterium]|nr:PAS domain S-box protein [Spirochaetales bacterium]